MWISDFKVAIYNFKIIFGKNIDTKSQRKIYNFITKTIQN